MGYLRHPFLWGRKRFKWKDTAVSYEWAMLWAQEIGWFNWLSWAWRKWGTSQKSSEYRSGLLYNLSSQAWWPAHCTPGSSPGLPLATRKLRSSHSDKSGIGKAKLWVSWRGESNLEPLKHLSWPNLLPSPPVFRDLIATSTEMNFVLTQEPVKTTKYVP